MSLSDQRRGERPVILLTISCSLTSDRAYIVLELEAMSFNQVSRLGRTGLLIL